MGYLGFGLNKWIYRQKSRKPFSKSNKPVGNTIEATSYSKDELIIQGRKTAHIEDIDKSLNERKERIAKRRRLSIFNGSLIIISIFVLGFVFINKSKQYNIKENTARQQKRKTIDEQKVEAYQMIMDYGAAYLKKKDYEKAIIEYKQAIKLYPDKYEATIGLANSYYFLCIDFNQDCNEAIRQFSVLIKQYPKSEFYLRKRADIYTHLGDYDKADNDLNQIEKN
ncbi:MAG: tetratricopeptide repeat protein [Bacteroidales bacterium]|nr:tetratricopeptide repeat protein [Bacteroidales bacterium]